MLLRCLPAVLAGALAWGLTSPASAEPQWPLVPGGAYHQRHPAYQPDNPDYHVVQPGQQQPANNGQYPWYGSAWGVPTYNWGYFGTHAYPTIKWHKGYYRDFLQWGQWRRY